MHAPTTRAGIVTDSDITANVVMICNQPSVTGNPSTEIEAPPKMANAQTATPAPADPIRIRALMRKVRVATARQRSAACAITIKVWGEGICKV